MLPQGNISQVAEMRPVLILTEQSEACLALIEQMAKDMGTTEQCEKTRNVTVFGKNNKERTALLFNPRCKTWSCDYCAEINKDYWIHQAARGTIIITSEGREVQFVTLTSRPYATPTTGLYFLKQNWPKLNRKLKYHTDKYKKNLGLEWSYFLVPEQHKTGVVHCHLLAATLYNTEKSWKEFAFDAGFGWKVDVQPVVTPERAANYVSKYLHKGAGKESWPIGFRRVRHSQNWPISAEQPMDGWEWSTYANDNTVWIEKNALLNMGWQVVDKRE